MNVYPVNLTIVEPAHLKIDWSDGHQRRYSIRELRDRCPCATCREKRKQPQAMLPILSAEEMQPLRVNGMKPVGNYAYAIEFSDGHDTGIYSFTLLLDFGEVDQAT